MQFPPLNDSAVDQAIVAAFDRCKKNKKGEESEEAKTAEELVALCLQHLRERSDPVLSPAFLSQLKAEDVFAMDAVAHEMQRRRMKIGVFYQFLMIELMRSASRTLNSNFKAVFDGSREGDAIADINTPGFSKGLRLYMSVKKSSDTVGGQDLGGVIRRLEQVAREEKNLTSPYMCVVGIATPPKGRIEIYNKGRTIRNKSEGYPYSPNCEEWTPGFIYPYITGLGARRIYERSLAKVDDFLPFYTLRVRESAPRILRERLIRLGLCDAEGNMSKSMLFDYILS